MKKIILFFLLFILACQANAAPTISTCNITDATKYVNERLTVNFDATDYNYSKFIITNTTDSNTINGDVFTAHYTDFSGWPVILGGCSTTISGTNTCYTYTGNTLDSNGDFNIPILMRTNGAHSFEIEIKDKSNQTLTFGLDTSSTFIKFGSTTLTTGNQIPNQPNPYTTELIKKKDTLIIKQGTNILATATNDYFNDINRIQVKSVAGSGCSGANCYIDTIDINQQPGRAPKIYNTSIFDYFTYTCYACTTASCTTSGPHDFNSLNAVPTIDKNITILTKYNGTTINRLSLQIDTNQKGYNPATGTYSTSDTNQFLLSQFASYTDRNNLITFSLSDPNNIYEPKTYAYYLNEDSNSIDLNETVPSMSLNLNTITDILVVWEDANNDGNKTWFLTNKTSVTIPKTYIPNGNTVWVYFNSSSGSDKNQLYMYTNDYTQSKDVNLFLLKPINNHFLVNTIDISNSPIAGAIVNISTDINGKRITTGRIITGQTSALIPISDWLTFFIDANAEGYQQIKNVSVSGIIQALIGTLDLRFKTNYQAIGQPTLAFYPVGNYLGNKTTLPRTCISLLPSASNYPTIQVQNYKDGVTNGPIQTFYTTSTNYTSGFSECINATSTIEKDINYSQQITITNNEATYTKNVWWIYNSANKETAFTSINTNNTDKRSIEILLAFGLILLTIATSIVFNKGHWTLTAGALICTSVSIVFLPILIIGGLSIISEPTRKITGGD